MNLKVYLITCLVAAVITGLASFSGYHSGWNEGRQNLVQQQQAQAQAKLAKQTTRQQANDSKAAAADESGKTTSEVITRDVIKYIKTPGRNVCVFDDTRVRTKRSASDNAATIPGYDDAAVQTTTSIK